MIEQPALGVRHGLDQAESLLGLERRFLAEMMKIRFYPLVLEHAEDCYLYDIDGNAYLDLAAGGAVMAAGYGNPRVRSAIEAALAAEWSTTSAIFAHRGQAQLAERLASLVEGDVKVWFGNSGSEAMDAAARALRAASGRERIIAFRGGFHGQTGGSGAISGMDSHEDLSSPSVDKVEYPYPYRCAHGPCDRETCSLRCLEQFEDALERSPGAVAGVVLEAIQSDGGDVIPPLNALARVGELCAEHQVWLAVDEVKVGLARTGRLFAYQHAGLAPDLVGLGKSLGGGLALSALVGRREILDVSTGTCAYTLGGSPAPCAAALATLDELEGKRLAEHAARVGAILLAGLEDVADRCPIVGEVRGLGLVAGIELVEDRVGRAPARAHAARLAYRLFELGAVAIVTGRAGNVIELTPPLTISEAEVRTAVTLIERALDDVAGGRFDDRKLQGYPGW
jgi:4-aminobutyrate aminotransferase